MSLVRGARHTRPIQQSFIFFSQCAADRHLTTTITTGLSLPRIVSASHCRLCCYCFGSNSLSTLTACVGFVFPFQTLCLCLVSIYAVVVVMSFEHKFRYGDIWISKLGPNQQITILNLQQITVFICLGHLHGILDTFEKPIINRQKKVSVGSFQTYVNKVIFLNVERVSTNEDFIEPPVTFIYKWAYMLMVRDSTKIPTENSVFYPYHSHYQFF